MKWLRLFNNNIREIEYFSESGKGMPNGSHIQRGGFLTECYRNANKFVTEGIAGEQYGLANYRGGIIVFATSVNSVELSKNKFANKAKQLWISFLNMACKDSKLKKCIDKYNTDKAHSDDVIGAFSVGNAFKGKYVDINTGKIFNDRSYTIEVGGISSKGLLNFAELVANEFIQQTVLVKDFNNMKFYLADGIDKGEPDNNSQTVWERIVNEPVESTIKRISAGIVNEMALPLRTFRQRVDGLQFQLIENWCLLKYCQLYSPNNVNVDHWGSEFLACADYIRGPEIKGGMNKQTTINKMFVVDYDYNQSRKILPIIQDKFDLEKICDSIQRENVAKEFSHSINELITFLSDTSISNAEYMKTTFNMDNYTEGFWTEVSGAMEHYFKKHGGFPIPNIYAKSLLKNPNLELDIDKYHYVGELGLPDANGNRKTDKKCIFGFNSVEFYNEVINKFEEYASFRDYVISDDKLPPKQKAESSKYLFIEIGMPEMVNDSIGYINYIEEMVHENGTNLTCMTPNMYSMLKRAVAILKDSLTTIHERFVSQISSNIEMGEDLLAETYPVEIHPITKDDY